MQGSTLAVFINLTAAYVILAASASACPPVLADTLQAGQQEPSLTELESAHARNPDDRGTALQLARGYLSVGDEGAAIAVLGDLIRRDPTDADARIELGQAYTREADYAAAEQQYRAALRARPDDAIAEEGLGQTLLFEGRYAEARRLLARAVVQDPVNVDARLGLATAESNDGHYGAARADYEAVRAQQPDNAAALVGLARAEFLSGDLPRASRLDALALSLSPNDTQALELRRLLDDRLAPAIGFEYTSTGAGPTFRTIESSAANWFASPSLELGALFSSTDLRAYGSSVTATRAGLVGSYSAGPAGNVDVQLVDSRFEGQPTTLDSRFALRGGIDGLSYQTGVVTGGVDGVADASNDAVFPAAAHIRVTTLYAKASARFERLSGDVGARIGYYNDDNHYREVYAHLARRFDYPGYSALTLSVAARVAGFSDNYSFASSHGYFDYLHQSDVVVSIAAQRAFSATGTVGLLASTGWRDTILTPGNSGAAPFTVVEPFVRATSGRTTLEADASFGRYSRGTYVAGYSIDTIRAMLEVRL